MKSKAEAACYSSPERAGLQIETLPFERIPRSSRLFLDYLRDAPALRRFYPSAVGAHHELAARAPEVLAGYRTDRGLLCDALAEMNTAWGAAPETLANITRLRQAETVAVVSGQQVGLLTGPLYTIYKALSAVKLAACLTERGTQAVPLFWLATEDHDWAEVQQAEFVSRDNHLVSGAVSSTLHREGTPVGPVVIDKSVEEVITNMLGNLPTTEFSVDVESLVRTAYAPGRTYGEAFARMMLALVGRYGLVLLDPLDGRLKQLVAPIYKQAAQCAPEMALALEQRSRDLEQAAYHAQVLTSAAAFPLFLHVNNRRRAIAAITPPAAAAAHSSDGERRYQAKGTKGQYTAEELAEWAMREPERFSPNVTLRAVVQDYLLPTIAYIGGAAEIAYFAQTAEIYRMLLRPVTPILHRASLTLVEHQTGRTLTRYNLHLSDLFDGPEAVTARVVEGHLAVKTTETLDKTDATVRQAIDDLRQELGRFDPTLAAALETAGRKISYQLNKTRSRFHRAQMAQNQAVHRQLEQAFTTLYPDKTLQERRINITSLLARHGQHVIGWIHDAIDPSSVEHQIVLL